MELTILMPCLNEAETLGLCVGKAQNFLCRSGIDGEVLVADNGSTDGSQSIAEASGARVVSIPARGYGAALAGGIASARGRYIIMGDADDSYDFSALDSMLGALREGSELVMGNRFRGGIAQGAMPFLHRYLGNPVLSFLGRMFYRAPIGDFHCGLRGFDRDAVRALHLSTSGMEFASEMVVKSSLHRLRISEVPVRLSKDGRSRPPHLRTWRDGWRHLRFLLLYSPRWLYLIPGLLLTVLGMLAMAVIGSHAVLIGNLGFDIHTMAYAGVSIVLGYQMLLLAGFTRLLGIRNGWLPEHVTGSALAQHVTLERCLILGGVLFAIGIAMTLAAIGFWRDAGFGALDPRETMRWVLPTVTILSVAGQTALAGFFFEALRLSAPRIPANEKPAQ